MVDMMDSVGVVIPAYRPNATLLADYVESLHERLSPAAIRIELDGSASSVNDALVDQQAMVQPSPTVLKRWSLTTPLTRLPSLTPTGVHPSNLCWIFSTRFSKQMPTFPLGRAAILTRRYLPTRRWYAAASVMASHGWPVAYSMCRFTIISAAQRR